MAGAHYSVTGAIVNGQPLDASVVKAAIDNVDEAVYQTNRGLYPFKRLTMDDDPTGLTVAGGAITITQGFHIIANENGDTLDALNTINGGTTNSWLYIKKDDDAAELLIEHNVGNIWLSRQQSYVLEGKAGLFLFFDGSVYTDATSLPFEVPTSDILAVQVFS